MTKLYHDAGAWVIPGAQGKGAERVDVPNAPQDLADWLNTRRVPPIAVSEAPAEPDVQTSEPPPLDERARRRAELLQRGAAIDVVTEAIQGADGNVFGLIFMSAIARLGELGEDGLRAIREQGGIDAYHRGLALFGRGPQFH